MSEKMTVIRAPGVFGGGFQNYGERTAEEMIRDLRKMHHHDLERAQKVLAMEDHEFEIEVVRGSIVGHHIKWIQHSSLKEPGQ
jgi:hypothetical protein